ncbi:MAG TPA: ribonuclease HI family protein [Thermodesulfobacteriota bacterium]
MKNVKQPSLPLSKIDKATVEIYIDGASRGNPGNSGAGVLIRDKVGNIHKIKRSLGILTNNQAEYEALITGLNSAKELKKGHLKIYTDSLLLANQINGIWRVTNPKIVALHKKARELIKDFRQVEVEHIPRELNREADKLANEAIDEYPY